MRIKSNVNKVIIIHESPLKISSKSLCLNYTGIAFHKIKSSRIKQHEPDRDEKKC